MKTPGELLDVFLGCQSRTSITFRVYTENIIFHAFLEKGHLSLPAQGRNIMFSGEKNTIFRDNTRKIMSQRGSF